MQWAEDVDGGYFANPPLSKKLREQAYGKMVFRQLANPIEGGLGKHRGEKIQFVRIGKVDTAGGAIPESSIMPSTKAPLDRGEVVATEYGMSIEYSGKLSDFSEFDVSNVFQRRLMDDMTAVLDGVIRNMIKVGAVVGTPTTATEITWAYNGTTATAGGAKLTVDHLRDIRQHMRELKITPFDDAGNYMLVGGPGVMNAIMSDDDWKQAARFGDPERIFAGEQGRIAGIRLLEESESTLSTSMIAGAAYAGEAYVFGADAFVEAITIAPELRSQKADFGRDQAVAWYALLGYGLTWDMTAGANSWSSSTDAKGKVRFIRIDGT